MKTIRDFSKHIVAHPAFEWTAATVILLNAVLVGVESYVHGNDALLLLQRVILALFTVELLLRFFARESLRNFFCSGWNIFDLVIVTSGYLGDIIPFGDNMLIFRTLRILRVLRLLRAAKEIRLISIVLIKSSKSLMFNGFFFLTFMYVFALLGNMLFKLPEPTALSGENAKHYAAFVAEAPHAPANSPDPYGTLGESMFTLFRITTGEDWTDIRYNLLTASKHGVIKPGSTVVTGFHILWYALSVFLFLNVLVGAFVSNYQQISEDIRKKNEPN